MKNSVKYYSVGALLYCPANNEGLAASIISGKFGNKFSLALCLEDTISDNHVEEAEKILLDSLNKIYEVYKAENFYLPKIFIRVRCPKQITSLSRRMRESIAVLAGFIAPKFSLDNADSYISAIREVNTASARTIYLMPIFESPDIINLQDRYSILYKLKCKIDQIEELILNIRVGGNDLCHMFGLRRHARESIHDIRPVDNIFTDIITVYGMDYVISGPVFEYYNGPDWEKGLQNEIAQDLLGGFIGKTVIHPNQIAIVNDALRVPKKDLEDARSILNWEENSHKLVSGSISNERMNEYKTHSNWALRTIFLAEYYGTK